MWKRISVLAATAFLVAGFALAEVSLDTERLNLEIRMQQRVEEALGKMLPAGQFVVVVKVEPVPPPTKQKAEAQDDGFFLPGVPMRRSIDGTGEQIGRLVDEMKTDSTMFQRFIRRITVTLVLDNDLPEDTVAKVRELTRQMLSLDAARGDTLDIQRTAFNKPVEQQVSVPTGIQKVQRELKSYWVLISLALIVFCISVFILFMFGPFRMFLNKFVDVLPTLKPQEQPANRMQRAGFEGMFPYMPPPYALPAAGGPNSMFSGSLQVENPNKTMLPFGFIREDHLANLAILLSRETPEKAAVVLGYLPPEWISRVLARMEPSLQSEVASSLATTRQLLPEQVEDIEQDLKRRLDYLIGGPERIIAVYESLDAEGQRRMLDNLKESRPELAEELRSRTFLFEDLEKLEPSALRALLREVDLQTMVMALRGASESLVKRVLEHMSEGKSQIVREELEMAEGGGGRPTLDAQRKIVMIAKRLEKEGQILIPQVESTIPTARYGASLRSTIKLPAGMETASPAEGGAEDTLNTEDFRSRVRRIISEDNDATGTGE